MPFCNIVWTVEDQSNPRWILVFLHIGKIFSETAPVSTISILRITLSLLFCFWALLIEFHRFWIYQHLEYILAYVEMNLWQRSQGYLFACLCVFVIFFCSSWKKSLCFASTKLLHLKSLSIINTVFFESLIFTSGVGTVSGVVVGLSLIDIRVVAVIAAQSFIDCGFHCFCLGWKPDCAPTTFFLELPDVLSVVFAPNVLSIGRSAISPCSSSVVLSPPFEQRGGAHSIWVSVLSVSRSSITPTVRQPQLAVASTWYKFQSSPHPRLIEPVNGWSGWLEISINWWKFSACGDLSSRPSSPRRTRSSRGVLRPSPRTAMPRDAVIDIDFDNGLTVSSRTGSTRLPWLTALCVQLFSLAVNRLVFRLAFSIRLLVCPLWSRSPADIVGRFIRDECQRFSDALGFVPVSHPC